MSTWPRRKTPRWVSRPARARLPASGFSAGFTVNPLAAFKDAYKEDTKNTKNGSFIGREIGKAEGAADGARAAMTVATLQFGSRSKNSTENHATSEARTSTLTAGKDLTILATDGSITSQGTQMSAEGNALLLAKDSIKLDVAHTTETKSQDSKTSGFSFDNRTAMMAGTLHNKSNGNGATDTVTDTTLSAGGSATIATQTGDITLIGANVASLCPRNPDSYVVGWWPAQSSASFWREWVAKAVLRE